MEGNERETGVRVGPRPARGHTSSTAHLGAGTTGVVLRVAAAAAAAAVAAAVAAAAHRRCRLRATAKACLLHRRSMPGAAATGMGLAIGTGIETGAGTELGAEREIGWDGVALLRPATRNALLG